MFHCCQGRLWWDLDDFDNREDMLQAVDQLSYEGGNTNTTGGLWVAQQEIFIPSKHI